MHTIHIPAVDNDDDSTKCEFSTFVEAGPFQPLVKELDSTKVIMMNEKVLGDFCLLIPAFRFQSCDI